MQQLSLQVDHFDSNDLTSLLIEPMVDRSREQVELSHLPFEDISEASFPYRHQQLIICLSNEINWTISNEISIEHLQFLIG